MMIDYAYHYYKHNCCLLNFLPYKKREYDEKGFENMKQKTSAINQSEVAERGHYITDSVISKDGTTIGYLQLGYGPGVVLVGGSMESARSHIQLADALTDDFTVYLPDRRGRGISGPYHKDYNMQKEVEDLDALLTKTGAHNVFGVSASGIIVLQAALTLPSIHKIALYEPALILSGTEHTAWLTRYDSEMAQGKISAALITSMKGLQLGPPVFNIMPRWLLEYMTNKMMGVEDKKAKDGDVTMRTLAPTLHYEGKLLIEMTGTQERFRDMKADVLLLSGSKGLPFLKPTLDALEKILPSVKCVEFQGLGHGGSGNVDNAQGKGNRPDLVARELQQFFVK
jgi:pimeloyl-ACP methyl ester carboxylesterase